MAAVCGEHCRHPLLWATEMLPWVKSILLLLLQSNMTSTVMAVCFCSPEDKKSGTKSSTLALDSGMAELFPSTGGKQPRQMRPVGSCRSRWRCGTILQSLQSHRYCISPILYMRWVRHCSTLPRLDMFLAHGNACIKKSGVNKQTHRKQWDGPLTLDLEKWDFIWTL